MSAGCNGASSASPADEGDANFPVREERAVNLTLASRMPNAP